MQRFTISLDDELAREFDGLIAARGYENRSEAVRDLIRARLGAEQLNVRRARHCVATVSYVYDHREHAVSARLADMQHDHHDLVVSTLRTHLDHDDCLETVVLRGSTASVEACARAMIALRGVRHGQVHLLPLHEEGGHDLLTGHGTNPRHKHLKPVNRFFSGRAKLQSCS